MKEEVINLIKETLPKMSEKEKLAFYLAFGAHEGIDQRDKSNIEYIYHPLWVYNHCETENEKIVALLHDVLEDTKITYDQILLLFNKEIADAVKILSHTENENIEEYYANIKKNPITRNVKIADLKHNMDKNRINKFVEWHNDRCEKLYEPMLDFLKND